MPFTMNGVGTHVCCARGDIGWGSADAMECLVLFFLPIVPYKAIHTFDWQGEQYRMVPIRWSGGLVLRTYAKPWSWGFLALAAVLLFIGFIDMGKGRGGATPLLFGLGAASLGVGILAQILLFATDKRNKAIRRVMGGVAAVGNCDPVHLTKSLMEQLNRDPKAMYGTETFADAVEAMMKRGSFAQAMWAARMCAAVEERRQGERLTDGILSEPEMAAAIERVRKKPDNWIACMLNEDERAQVELARKLDVRATGTVSIPAPPPTNARRYDDDEDDQPRRPQKRDENIRRGDDY